MAKITMDETAGDFDKSDVWRKEDAIIARFFERPRIKLATFMFGIYTQHELPYWYFKTDARRHAERCVRSGIYDADNVVDDYVPKIWMPSQRIILNGDGYDSMMDAIVNGLPHGPNRIPYSQVIRGRFGFNGKAKGSDSLSKEFGLNPARIEELEKRAFNIMRHPSRSSAIKDYLETQRWAFMKYLRSTGYL